MAKKIIVGNWKMNPETLKRAKDIYASYAKATKKLKKTDVVVCPPYMYTHSLHALKGASRLSLGAQDTFFEEKGSYTGEVSTKMLKDAGVTHVIVGHSERRKMGETDELVNKKVHAVVGKGLTAVMCIGESDRDKGGKFYTFIQDEIVAGLKDVPTSKFNKIIIAYEPIWAIGASEAMDGARMYEMSIFIKKVITDAFGDEAAKKVRIIYGGSVDSDNIESIITEGRVDGVLPGRASLNPKEFGPMIEIVDSLS